MLSGLKSIAEYLGVSARRVRTLVNEHALPVKVVPGARRGRRPSPGGARYLARTERIDEWIEALPAGPRRQR